MGLQSSIRSNKSKSIFLAILFPVFLWVLTTIVLYLIQGYDMGNRQTAWKDSIIMGNELFIFLGPVILIWGLISFFFYRQIIFSFAGARPITRKESPEIYNIVENLCISRGLQCPKIGIIDDDSFNAFATGRNMQNGRIVFSRGIINKLSKAEIEAVAGHELTHIINKDCLLMIVIVVFIGVIGTLGQILIRISGRDSEGKTNGLFVVGIVLLILGYLIYPFIQLAISRKREFLADAGSVILTKDKLAMISALKNISQDSVIESIQKDTIATMCIASPFTSKKGGWFKNMLSTHPAIEDRIKALETY